jgi:hypothetical protein
MSNDANKGYQFTVLNGAVTAVYEIKNGRAKFEKMDRDETWTVDGANIIKTESEHGRIETTTYSDINGDGIFAKMSKSYGTVNPVIANSSSLISGSDNDDQWRGNNSDDHCDSVHGDDAFTYVGAAANVTTANANGAVWFENGILYGSNDRDTAAEFQIQLVGVTDLLATDLIL